MDIFFVISGFLISKSIIIQSNSDSFNLTRFYEGRFKRIVPAYFLMMIFCIAIAIFNFPKIDFTPFFERSKEALFFLSNQAFSTTTDYFGTANHEKLLLHTWSLSIEMQFYLFLPLIFILLKKRFRLPAFIFIFIIFLAFTEYQLLIRDNRSKMYFSLIPRSLEFMFGIFLNYLPKPDRIGKNLRNSIGFIALIPIVGSLFLINEHTVFPGLFSFPVCIGTAAIIWAEDGKVNRFFSAAPLVYIGKISYSLYLWHWPVLAFYRYKTSAYQISPVNMIWLVCVFTALSLISFYLVEEPFRKLKGKKLLQYGILACIFAGLFWRGSNVANNKAVPIPIEYVNHVPFINHNQYTGYMLIGDTTVEDNHILLIGDSHCLSMLDFFEDIGKKNGLNFSFISVDAVLPIPGFENYDFGIKEHKERYLHLAPIGDSLISQSDIVIVVRQWYNDYDFDKQTKYFENKIKPNQSVIFVKAYPTFDFDSPRKYLSLIQPKDFKKDSYKKTHQIPELEKLIQKKPNYYKLDLSNDKVFDQAPFMNDTLAYYNGKHINFYGAHKLAESAGDDVAELLKKITSKKSQ